VLSALQVFEALFFLGFSTDRFIKNRSYVFGHSGFAAWNDGTACGIGEIV
jgi:hypothetical protein